MYGAILTAHSWIRWAALVGGVGATLAASATRPGSEVRAAGWGLFLVIAVDVQALLGLMLYFFLSPFTHLAFADFGAAMSNPALRFWAVEHATMMLLAVVVVHVTRVLGRTAKTAQRRRVRQMSGFALATIIMLLATPWPGLPNGRPLFRV
jgi:hypothetical protein